ncbi:anthrone oxygenase family protein [Lentisalinibacter salinarum]|uniref:anthrone oxygenase family protein n=1 Tax=Lentisalinibacter salinarum TaxID=2992239 RepID=UPI00386DBD7B
MSTLTELLAVVALLGSALVAGVFFAFSSFVMGALARLPAAQGVAAMQSINVVVLNRSFLGLFVGTTVVSAVLAGLAAFGWGSASAPWYVAGALSYLAGTFGVTGMGNVPLNDRLAAVPAEGAEAVAVWEHYLVRWTRLNTLRTIAAAGAALMLLLGLLRGGVV